MFPGGSAHLELAELVRAGLTPYEALATGTLHAGGYFSQHIKGAGPVGTATVGSRADLVLLDANPLVDVANAARIHGVFVRGTWLARDDITGMRDRASSVWR
jgi:imidazolonepropionase-like amidohydrolase